jgi:hypothetical protein
VRTTELVWRGNRHDSKESHHFVINYELRTSEGGDVVGSASYHGCIKLWYGV